ncbi:MAG: amino acid ABC transporter substrate-binding protein [Desulfitobacteriaceae bacterium]
MQIFRHNKRIFGVLSLLLSLLILLAGCGSQGTTDQSSKSDVVRIGVALSMTGALAREGDLTKKGYELWKDTVNEQGGINVAGKKMKVDTIYYDDKSDAPTAGKLVEKLITEDHVNYIFGPYGSGITAAASSISEKYQIPMIAPLANADSIYTRGFKYIFGVLYPVSAGFGLHIDLLNSLQPKPSKLAIIYPDDLFPSTAAEAAKKKAESMGFQVVYYSKYPKGTQDLSAVLSQVKSSGAEALISSGYFEDNVLMVKTAKELKLDLKYLGGMGAPLQADFVKTLGKDAEYVYGVSWWEASAGWKGSLYGSSQDYNELFKKRYGESATYYSAAATAAGTVLQMAIEKAGTLDSAKVTDALRALDVETFFSPIKFDQSGFNRAGSGVMTQIVNGKNTVVWPLKLRQSEPVYPAPAWDKRN